MKMTKLGKLLYSALCLASPTLAQDAALGAAVGSVTKRNFKREDIKSKILALDSDMEPEKVDAVLDAMMDVENDPSPKMPEAPTAPEATSPEDKLRGLLAGKVDEETLAACLALMMPMGAGDEFPDKKKDDEKLEKAMDALRKDMRDTLAAMSDVRPIVGEVIGMDSAPDVYRFALDQLKIDHKDVNELAALKGLFKIGSIKPVTTKAKVQIAQDSDVTKQFPGLSRFL